MVAEVFVTKVIQNYDTLVDFVAQYEHARRLRRTLRTRS
jgi:hypothetical protein